MDNIFFCFGLCSNPSDSCEECWINEKIHVKISPKAPSYYCDEKKKSKYTVLVTGMGAFPKDPGNEAGGHYSEDNNASHLITKLLPSKLAPFSEYNSTALEIEILNPTSGPGCAVKSEYGYVRKYCKELWESYGNKIDFIIHLGMADGWEWYTLERSAWKEGTVKSVDEGNGRMSEPLEYYMPPDDVGETSKDLSGPCPWGETVPNQLWAVSGIDVDRIAQQTEQALNLKSEREGNGKIEVRPHPDAGNYICGFISYESFAQAFVNRYSAKAIFCHVPGWQDEERLETGRDFVCHLIGQLATQ